MLCGALEPIEDYSACGIVLDVTSTCARVLCELSLRHPTLHFYIDAYTKFEDGLLDDRDLTALLSAGQQVEVSVRELPRPQPHEHLLVHVDSLDVVGQSAKSPSQEEVVLLTDGAEQTPTFVQRAVTARAQLMLVHLQCVLGDVVRAAVAEEKSCLCAEDVEAAAFRLLMPGQSLIIDCCNSPRWVGDDERRLWWQHAKWLALSGRAYGPPPKRVTATLVKVTVCQAFWECNKSGEKAYASLIIPNSHPIRNDLVVGSVWRLLVCANISNNELPPWRAIRYKLHQNAPQQLRPITE